ncbi:protein phosphatase 2C domain-containing protein [Streptomyces sp. NPDC048269]|uniref:protein phosphatase 2C domain-containing protein n=1 Tax=Streptomyces sp. NPDC048269 TaxID=3155753 RepID=UPI003421A8C0
MSQQGAGADDWWQKLYEDPDAVPEADPGDTLDNRFRSASVLTTDPVPGADPGPASGPGPGSFTGSVPAPPGPEPVPGRPPAPPPAAPAPPAAEPLLPGPRRSPPPPPPGWPPAPPPAPPLRSAAPQPPLPGTDRAPGRDAAQPGGPPQGAPMAGADPTPAAPPSYPARESGPPQPPLPGTGRAPGRGSAQPGGPPDAAPPVGDWSAHVAVPSPVAPPGEFAPAEPTEVPPPPAAPPGPGPAPEGGPPGPGLLPGPRVAAEQQPPAPPAPPAPPQDPRAGGVTGYVLGDVDVPPVQPPGLPARRRDAPRPGPAPVPEPAEPDRRAEVRHLGDRAPTYAAEPGALPPADPAALDGLIPDTVLEGARYGTYTLRAASLRGDSARFRGEARRDFLLTARFGGGDDALVLVALAGGDRAAPGASEAAAELCRTIAAAVGRSQERLAYDIRAGRRDALRSGLQRLTDRGYGRLRARAAELGLAEDAYTAGVRGLLLPVDPECRTRVCFGAGAGGLFRLRAGAWQDLEPVAGTVPPADSAEAGEPADGGFRFRASVARPGDTLLLCSGGMAEPMREEAVLVAELAARWADPEPPGLAAFLADTQLRLKGYADDRTAAAVWEA